MKGFTLVELMVTIAVIAVLAAISIPLYSGYVREGHFSSMRSSLSRLRTDIEDFRLENETYVNVGTSAAVAPILAELNSGPYTYAVTATTNSYDVTGVFTSAVWVRCDIRFSNCCDPDTPGATNVTSACP